MRLFHKILLTGLDQSASERDNLKTRALNSIALFTTIFNFGYIVFNAWIEQYLGVLVNVQFAITALLIFYFNFHKKSAVTTFITSIGYPLGFIAAALLIGDGFGCEYFFLITASATPLLYERKQMKYLVFFANLLIFIGIKIVYIWHPEGFSANSYPPYFEYINDLVIILLLFLVINNAFSNNVRFQLLLLKQNKTIRTLNSTLEHKVEERTAEIQAKATALAKSNEEIKRIAYIASHDLKEPLRNIASFSQLIQRNLKNGRFENIDEYTNYINWAIKRMDRLTNDIAIYTEIERRELEVENFDFKMVLENVLSDLEPLIQKRCAKIQIPNQLPTLVANTNQIQLILYNLFENALLHSKVESLEIQLLVQNFPDFWQLEIRDNGRGIEKDYHEEIFTMFKRLQNEVGQENSGIGLALCKKIVENHRGKIWLSSEKNQGAIFKFSLWKHFQEATPLGNKSIIQLS